VSVLPLYPCREPRLSDDCFAGGQEVKGVQARGRPRFGCPEGQGRGTCDRGDAGLWCGSRRRGSGCLRVLMPVHARPRAHRLRRPAAKALRLTVRCGAGSVQGAGVRPVAGPSWARCSVPSRGSGPGATTPSPCLRMPRSAPCPGEQLMGARRIWPHGRARSAQQDRPLDARGVSAPN